MVNRRLGLLAKSLINLDSMTSLEYCKLFARDYKSNALLQVKNIMNPAKLAHIGLIYLMRELKSSKDFIMVHAGKATFVLSNQRTPKITQFY